MLKISTLIVSVFFLFAGCIATQTSSDNHFEEVSREIARLKSEASTNASIGDNIKITVNLLTTSVEDHFAIDTLLQNVYGNVTVTKNPEIHAQSGLQIGVAIGNFRAQLNITKKQLKSSEETELFLLLADGATGHINVGREISVPRFYYLGQWYNGIEYEFKKAGRSIKVTVHRLPSGLIEMELTPVFSRFLSDGGNLEMTELTTKVVASPGEIVVIGGGDTSGENVANALLGYSKESNKTQTLITVTPQIK